MHDLVCSVDVGTSSARAGLFDRSGRMLARAECAIAINRPMADHAEHNSEDIWRAVCQAVHEAAVQAGAQQDQIKAICFDATCSLVVRAQRGEQVSVSTSNDAQWDTIAWIDHRAKAEAAECTSSGHKVLDYLGGTMSPEMQVPKLMWLKRHLPESWTQAVHFFDLADFLSWRASGLLTRSNCTLTCKWTYLSHADGWQRDFLGEMGVDEILRASGLSDPPARVGSRLGPVTEASAKELGVAPGCIVAAGLIDAFAGALGTIGGIESPHPDRHLALIGGTSSCIMCFSKDERRVPNIWGPYFGATLDGLWVTEGGQSATGALLDYVSQMFAGGQIGDERRHERIVERIQILRRDNPASLGQGMHVLPDFHGNRSPYGDAAARGVISGMTLDQSFDGVCALYWRTAISIALGVRQILGHLMSNGYAVDSLSLAGGHTQNPLLVELYADVTGTDVRRSTSEDAVLLGSAMAAASAAGWYSDLQSACQAMRQDSLIQVSNPDLKAYYDREYSVFLKMQEHRNELEAISGS